MYCINFALFPCRHLIEVQHIVRVLVDWLAPQVHKTKKGARILIRHGYSVKSFAMQWTFVMPIGVSENNDTVKTALHPYHTVMSNSMINLITIHIVISVTIRSRLHSSQGQLTSVYSEVLTFLSCHGKWLAQSVTVVFLSLLLILAGDVEVNPGPGKGKEKAASS